MNDAKNEHFNFRVELPTSWEIVFVIWVFFYGMFPYVKKRRLLDRISTSEQWGPLLNVHDSYLLQRKWAINWNGLVSFIYAISIKLG